MTFRVIVLSVSVMLVSLDSPPAGAFVPELSPPDWASNVVAVQAPGEKPNRGGASSDQQGDKGKGKDNAEGKAPPEKDKAEGKAPPKKDKAAGKAPPKKDQAEGKAAPAETAPAKVTPPAAAEKAGEPKSSNQGGKATAEERGDGNRRRGQTPAGRKEAAPTQSGRDRETRPDEQKVETDRDRAPAAGQPSAPTAPPDSTAERTPRQDTRETRRAREGGDRRRGERGRRGRDGQETPSKDLSRTEVKDGERAVIDGGARVIVRENGRAYIRHDDDRRFRRHGGDRRVETLPNGRERIVIELPRGGQLITVRDRQGRIIRRVRRSPDGRRIVLIDNRDRGPRPLAELNLGPLRITIPRERYVVDSRRASPGELREALVAPPVERVERNYSLEEIRRYERVRDIMRRIDVSTITFDLDSAEITRDQLHKLESLGLTIRRILENDPDEVFLIEGHTDATGTEIHNLALSDRRADAVASALTEAFDVPPENLVTQGYGESHLKIPTEEKERENRRVAVRRITPLLRGADASGRR